MFNKFIMLAFSIFLFSGSMYAADDSCSVTLAISTPPIKKDQSVAINISNTQGFSKSLIMQGGTTPQAIDKIVCSKVPYSISATLFSSGTDLQTIGACHLKSGSVVLGGPNSSVSVVFPNDFKCSKGTGQLHSS